MVIVGVVVLLAGCSGGSRSLGTSSTSVADTTITGVDPNAPETNDPGDIPDNQVFVACAPSPPLYSVKVPEGWARSERADTTVFTDKFNSIMIESKAVTAQPTVASATKDEVPQVQAASTNVSKVKVTQVSRKAGPSVRITYEADSPPNTVTGKSTRLAVERYEFWKNGTEVVITLSGAKGADNVDPWKIVTDGFAWTA
jgi:hypothetical protein